tara:strand:+ start:75 stop:1046 length:972 start_codon:yes stop_codon:yes gene_type:complete
MDKRNVYLHAQLARAGGGTIIPMLSRNMPGMLDSCMLPIPERHFSKSQIADVIRYHPDRRWFSSHLFSLDMPFDLPNNNVLCLTLIREPAARIVSCYDSMMEEFDCTFPEVDGISLEEFVKRFVIDREQSTAKTLITSYLTDHPRYLAGPGVFDPLSRIKEVMEQKKLLIFPVDEIEKTFVTLERWFPEDFPDASFSWSTNSARKKTALVPVGVRNNIRDALPDECEMHRLSHEFLSEKIADLFDSKTDLNKAILDFRRRCRQRQHAQRWHYRIRKCVDFYLKLRGFAGRSGIPAFRYEWPGHSKQDVRPDPSQWSAPPPEER